jgi:cytochrome c peroxidase
MALAAKHRDVPLTPAAVPPPEGLTVEMLDRMTRFPGDLGVLPANNLPISPAQRLKIDLGRKLFFDSRLSLDRASSCATCHDPQKAFGDGRPLPTGFRGAALLRHTPTLLNVALGVLQFWDGRAVGLEAQAVMPIMAGGEMNMGSEVNIVQRLHESPDYDPLFQEVYGSSPNLKLLGDAIAAFESTLTTPDSPFDRYVGGDRNALTLQQKRGLALMVGKAGCVQCHSGPNLTDGKFHNIGLQAVAGSVTDLGRFEVTGREQDRGAFKTPTLRNIAITAPYMHNGSIASLEAVIDHYDRGGENVPGKSDLIFELGLTRREKLDLIALLRALTGTFPSNGQASKSAGVDQ